MAAALSTGLSAAASDGQAASTAATTKATALPPPARAVLEALGRQALHAYLLVLEHPSTGEVMEWTAPLPADLQALKAALEAAE